MGGRKRRKGGVRVGFIIKLLEDLDTSGEEAALELVTRRDEHGGRFQVSHYCRVPTTELCLETTHFGLETAMDNRRRSRYQHRELVCDCADLGLRLAWLMEKLGRRFTRSAWEKSSPNVFTETMSCSRVIRED